ncbi:uncharacterized protein EI97DRAFT_90714 [Westerdykella ornata]|uniref:Uncharacterized protein n=1 Tax=Westerdykella ornata TaxID=318751 RepID=A0A6A6JEI6_WESOR|nr:uncharacterized protein EI97DRAFT_90714 [Westerdykella ornata]KAF2274832.1 hypothetical protein EI97DRAFT_90714 [Westerdykella ornata]
MASVRMTTRSDGRRRSGETVVRVCSGIRSVGRQHSTLKDLLHLNRRSLLDLMAGRIKTRGGGHEETKASSKKRDRDGKERKKKKTGDDSQRFGRPSDVSLRQYNGSAVGQDSALARSGRECCTKIKYPTGPLKAEKWRRSCPGGNTKVEDALMAEPHAVPRMESWEKRQWATAHLNKQSQSHGLVVAHTRTRSLSPDFVFAVHSPEQRH